MSQVIDTDIHAGDWGTIFRVTYKEEGVAVDISAATTQQILLKNPGKAGVATGYTTTFTNTGTDGKAQYTTASGNISVAGVWAIQGHIILPTGEFWSRVKYFVVQEIL